MNQIHVKTMDSALICLMDMSVFVAICSQGFTVRQGGKHETLKKEKTGICVLSNSGWCKDTFHLLSSFSTWWMFFSPLSHGADMH